LRLTCPIQPVVWCELVSVVAIVQELSRSTEVVAANGAKMPAVVVLAHALRHFSQQAVREISEQSATPLSNDDIRWVVTVPAIWTAAAKQLMRQAAYDVSVCVSPTSLCLRSVHKPYSKIYFWVWGFFSRPFPSFSFPSLLSLSHLFPLLEMASLIQLSDLGSAVTFPPRKTTYAATRRVAWALNTPKMRLWQQTHFGVLTAE